ncbi:MAG: mycothiol system anti-sigma-R factor [Actinomycetota bacterium]
MNRPSPAYQCEATIAHVDEFIDGELCDREAEGVESHLLLCGDCRRVFQTELDLKLLVRRSCACEAVPDSVRDRVSVMVSRWRLDMAPGAFTSFTSITTFRVSTDARRPDRRPGTGTDPGSLGSGGPTLG